MTTRLDNAEFFRTLLSDDSGIESDLADEATRYAGTGIGDSFAELQKRHEALTGTWTASLRRTEAERDLVRASDYMEGERYRLAKLFLETIVSAHPETDEADLAEARLTRLRQLMNTPKEK
jgi:hypothetical protein